MPLVTILPKYEHIINDISDLDTFDAQIARIPGKMLYL